MKRSKDWNEAKFKRFIKEGRGQGDLSEYKPWLTIQDIPSKGRATRVFGFKTNRIHHFFSDIQSRYFYLLEWENKVLDIKEHYPLLDCREVIKDEELNLEKYKSNDKTDYVFTTTFLVKVKTGKSVAHIARSVKASHELENKGTIERLEICRKYWKDKGIDWGIVTNKEIPLVKVKNIEWVLSSLELDKNEMFNKEDKMMISKMLETKLYRNSKPIREIVAEFDYENNLDNGTSLLFFKYLIAKKRIEINMESKIDLNVSANESIIIKPKGSESEEYAFNC